MNRIKGLREERGINQTELCKILGIKQQTLSGYELSQREPDNDMLKKIADYFDVSTDYLLGRTNDKRTRIMDKEELPKELVDAGLEYLEVLKEFKKADITPADLKELLDILKKHK